METMDSIQAYDVSERRHNKNPFGKMPFTQLKVEEVKACGKNLEETSKRKKNLGAQK